MKEKKIKKAILLIVISIAIVYILVIGYQFYNSFSQSLPLTFEVPKEYKELFLTKYRDKFSSCINHNYKNRTPVSAFDLKDYNIVVFKFPLAKDNSLLQTLKIGFEHANNTKGTIYENLNRKYFRLEQKSGPQTSLSQIYVTLNGNNLKTVVKNDSIVSYGLIFKDFFIKTGLNDDVYIYANYDKEGFGKYNPVPINLLFLKRNHAVYFILLSNKDLKKKFEYNTLYDLMFGNDL